MFGINLNALPYMHCPIGQMLVSFRSFGIALPDKCLFLSAPSELIDSCNSANRNIALSGNSKI